MSGGGGERRKFLEASLSRKFSIDFTFKTSNRECRGSGHRDAQHFLIIVIVVVIVVVVVGRGGGEWARVES